MPCRGSNSLCTSLTAIVVLAVTVEAHSLSRRWYSGIYQNVTWECTRPGPMCSSCNQVSICVLNEYENGTSFYQQQQVDTCEADEGCNHLTARCMQRVGECYGGIKFRCHDEGIFPDPYDCNVYYSCGSPPKSLDPVVEYDYEKQYFCPWGSAFNAGTEECDLSDDDQICVRRPVPPCEELLQTGSLEANPNIYYSCVNVSGRGLQPKLFRCAENEALDAESLVCRSKPETTKSPTEPVTVITPTVITGATTDSARVTTVSSTTSSTTTTGATTPTTTTTTITEPTTTTTTVPTTPTMESTTTTTTITTTTKPTTTTTTNEPRTTESTTTIAIATTTTPTTTTITTTEPTTTTTTTTESTTTATTTTEPTATESTTTTAITTKPTTTTTTTTKPTTATTTTTESTTTTTTTTEPTTTTTSTTEPTTTTTTTTTTQPTTTTTTTEPTTTTLGSTTIGEFHCTAEGTFPDPKDCHSFYRCANATSEPRHDSCFWGHYEISSRGCKFGGC